MSNAKRNEGNGDEGNGEEGNLVLPEVTDWSQNKALHQLSWSVEGETVHTLFQSYSICTSGIHHRGNCYPACLPKQPSNCLWFQTLDGIHWSWWGPVRHWGERHWGGAGGCVRALVLSVSLTFIAEGTLAVTENFKAGSESYSAVTIYSAFQSVKWNISLAAVSPVPFKPEPPDIWRSWILWIG